MRKTNSNYYREKCDVQRFLQTVLSVLEVLTEEDKKYLCENTTEEYFEKEQAVHNNMGCSGLYFVKNGKLRLYMLSEDGKEITLYRLSPGDICMLSASCVLQSITFDVYVDAEVPSDCYRISGSAFSNVSARYLEVKNYALETAVDCSLVIQYLLIFAVVYVMTLKCRKVKSLFEILSFNALISSSKVYSLILRRIIREYTLDVLIIPLIYDIN